MTQEEAIVDVMPKHFNEPITLPIPANCEVSKESRDKERCSREYLAALKEYYENPSAHNRDLVEARRQEHIKAAEAYAAKWGIRPPQELYEPPIYIDAAGVVEGTDPIGVCVAGIACFLGIAGLLAGIAVAIAEAI